MENQVNVFELATRQKLRFDTPKGALSVEDLWELPLTSTVGKANLDSIAVELHKKLNESSVSFVSTRSTNQKENDIKFQIVKHIIDTKMKESADAALARERAAKKDMILGELARREETALLQMGTEELKELIQKM